MCEWLGARDLVALGVVDPEGAENAQDLSGFDELGDRLFAQSFRELHERLDDELIGAVGVQLRTNSPSIFR